MTEINIRIKFVGPPGSGKTIVNDKIQEFLLSKGLVIDSHRSSGESESFRLRGDSEKLIKINPE